MSNVSQHTIMLMRILLFPRAAFLTDKWWHRLAMVMFWLWLPAVLIGALHFAVLSPFRACIDVMVSLGAPVAGACGSNAFSYAFMPTDSLSINLLNLAFAFAGLYLSLCMPGLSYRLALYVIKGGSWKDQPRSAA
jgi:hypothetical protein